MNKTFLILVSAILLIGMVSATTIDDSLQGWLNDGQATNVNLAISPHQTQVSFHLDTSSYPSLDNISSVYNSMSISTTISSVLNGVNLQTNLNNGNYPTFSNVDLLTPVTVSLFSKPVPMYILLNYGLISAGITDIQFTNNTAENSQILNNLAKQTQNQLQTIQGNTIFTKNGDDYTITYNQGWEDANVQSGDYSQYVNQIQNIIQQYAGKSFNIKDLITNYIFPVSQIGDNVKILLGSNLDKFDYTISGVELNNAINSLRQTYDLSSLTNLKDGTYNIPVVFAVNGVQVNKMISVTLSGIPTQQTYYELSNNACTLKTLFPVQVDNSKDYSTPGECEANILYDNYRLNNNVCTLTQLTASQKTSKDYANQTDCLAKTTDDFVPTDSAVSKWFNKLTLPYGFNLVSVIFLDPSSVKSAGSHIKVLKIVNITVDKETSGAISFSVNKSEISNKNRISLYVLEGTSWTKLATTYTGETAAEYQYTATTPHFSTFMIAEDTTPSSSGSAGGGDPTTGYIGTMPTISTTNNEITPISTTTNTRENQNPTGTSSPITGGVIGFIKSGAGIVTILVLMITVLLTMVVFSLKKRR